MTLLSSAPSAQVGTRPDRLAVPWTTVLTLAVLLDAADGFFMTALRNAVGAIERAVTPRGLSRTDQRPARGAPGATPASAKGGAQ